MISRSCKYIVLALLVLAVWAPQLSAKESTSSVTHSFLWEVRSDGGTAFILGSIHFANKELYPLNTTIENAFARSSALVVELNPLNIDEKEMERAVQDRGLYKGDETIGEHISEETYNLLKNFIRKRNIPLQNIIKLRPAMLAITLSSIQLVQMGFTPEYGIDRYFCQKAATVKPIIELESMEEQLSMLFDMPDENLFLNYTLSGQGETEVLFKGIIESWSNGDPDAMEQLIFNPYKKDPRLKPILERIFYKRNISMAAKIMHMLENKQEIFVVVGAGHLVGKKGILQILQDRKYRIRQL